MFADLTTLLAHRILGVVIAPEEIDTARIVVLGPGSAPTTFLILDMATAESAERIIAAQSEVRPVRTFAGQTYFRSKANALFIRPSVRRLVLAYDEAAVLRSLAAGETGAATTQWANQWPQIADMDAAVVMNGSLLQADVDSSPIELMLKILRKADHTKLTANDLQAASLMRFLGSLSEHSEYSTFGLHTDDGVQVRFVGHSTSEELATTTSENVLTVVADLRRMLRGRSHELAAQPDAANLERIRRMDGIDEALENAILTRESKQAELTVTLSPPDAQYVVSLVASPMVAGREKLERRPSLENLARIGRAFLDYHRAHNEYPAAIQKGSGSAALSWRVSILPYLGYQELYDAYRKDQPWDSTDNKKVLARIPDVYRCPADHSNSTNTAYFVFIGNEAILSRPSKDRDLDDVIDGTSNTILAVESKHNVPWTKPDDIRFDSKAPLPELGGWYPGGFNVVMFDGRAWFIPDEMDAENVKSLITPRAGELVRLPVQP